MKRREFIKIGLGTSVAVLAAPAILRAAPEFTFKWGNSLPASHPMVSGVTKALDIVREKTNGRLHIQMFADAQLGGDGDMLSQVRSGALEFYTTSASAISQLQPEANIVNMPFAFGEQNAVWSAVDGPLGKYVTDMVSTGTRLHAFSTIWENGFRHVTNSVKPIEAPEDLAGLKIRVPSSPLNVALFKALGASPTIMSVHELYSALQTHIVDAQENPIIQVSIYNLNEVQSYCSLTHHVWDGFIHVCNADLWQRLSDDLKPIVDESLTEAGLLQRQESATQNQELIASLEAKGMKFNQPDTSKFRAALIEKGFYAEQKAARADEAWTLLEDQVGKLG